MTTVAQKLLNMFTVPSVSLEWGSHRSEFGLQEHIGFEQSHGEDEWVNLGNPITGRPLSVFLPRPVTYHLRNVTFEPRLGTVSIDGFPIRESLPYYYQCPFPPKRSAAFVRKSFPRVATALNLQSNYHHFLLEDLPRLILLKKKHGCGAVFSGGWRTPGFVYDFLERLEVDVIPLSTRRKYDELWFTAVVGQLGVPSQYGAKLVREAFPPRSDSKIERIYISRQGAQRSFFNEDLLANELVNHGFSVVHLEKMNIDQQISIMAGAKLVVAPHGAGLANMTFLRDGARVVEISDCSYSNPVFQALASDRLQFSQIFAGGDHEGDELDLRKAVLKEIGS